jgi:hypothetical protein
VTVQLAPTAVIHDRPFTDLRHTRYDLHALRFMISCACLALETLPTRLPPPNPSQSAGDSPRATCHAPPPLIIHQPNPDHWTQRLILTQPQRLRDRRPLTVVGFFGLKSPVANVALAQELDRELIPELTNHAELLAYVSICLPTGNFGNLVLFASPEGKEAWGLSERHSAAVRLLTPDYYAAVRLYNGQLPDGVAACETLRLHLVKYYDYTSRPLWRAVRPLSAGDEP